MNQTDEALSSWKGWIPLVVFVVILFFLWRGLSFDPHKLPSVLIDKPSPVFSLATLADPRKEINQSVFNGKITLLNVWASWCEACRVEHPVLMDIAASKQVQLIGLDYKDSTVEAQKSLQEWGDPYHIVLLDKAGRVAINFGVYGTPESFLIDQNGIIRNKIIGEITPTIWKKTLLPNIRRLAK